MFHTIGPAFLLFLNFSNLAPESFFDDFLYIVSGRGGPDPLNIKVFYLLINNLFIWALPHLLTCGRVNDIDIEFLADSFNHLPENHALFSSRPLFVLSYFSRQRLFFLVGGHTASGESFRFYHHSFIPAGQLKRVVFDVFAGSSEYSVQEFFLRCQFCLALGYDLTYEDITRTNSCSFADYSVFIKVSQRLFADIWNITGEFFSAEAGLANFSSKFVDVYAGKAIVLAEFFTDNNGVLKVKAVKRDESDK